MAVRVAFAVKAPATDAAEDGVHELRRGCNAEENVRTPVFRFVTWWDWVLAIVWFVAVFAFCFRSPLYWKLGDVPGYPLTEQTAFGIAGRAESEGGAAVPRKARGFSHP